MGLVLELECIGDDSISAINSFDRLTRELGFRTERCDHKITGPWVAEIVGGADWRFKFQRQFLRGQKDYSRSNSVGSRGIYKVYILVEGKVYEIFERITWKQTARYFCRVEGDQRIRMTEDEVRQWLKDHTEDEVRQWLKDH